MKQVLFAASLLLTLGAQAADTEFKGYDVLSRYKQIEDKFKTHEMLTPYGHDFIFNANAYLNKNLFDLIDDVSKVGEDEGNELVAAEKVLNKYEDTEQSLRVNVLVGIPIFSFKAWGVKFVPDLRLGANMGAHLGIKSDIFGLDDILEFVSDEIPADMQQVIIENKGAIETNMPADRDIVQALIDADVASGGTILTAPQRLVAEATVGQYFLPVLATKVPVIHMYTKLDVQGGFDINLYKNRWFGKFSLYGLHRTDYLKRISAQKLAADDGLFDDAKNLNSTLYLANDLKVGYKTNRYSMWTAVEELKLATLNDNKDKAGDVYYGMNPRFRLHGDALFKFGVVTFMPFSGIHYQADYELMDGLYGGADWGIHVWKGRIGVRMRTMLDNEHITLAPKLKFGFGHLEYMLKLPFVGEKDGVTPSAIHAANFRLFF